MRKILLAFPSPIAAESLSLVLGTLGAQIIVAASARAMVEELMADSYSLLLTGYLAPFMCGDDLVGRLARRSAPRPTIFVISHLRCEHSLLSLYESGVDQFLSFPLSPPRLLRKVAEELSSRP